MQYIDTRLSLPSANSLAEMNAKVQQEGWHEVWTVRMCGRDLVLPIDFTPTPTGVSFRINVTAATLAPPR